MLNASQIRAETRPGRYGDGRGGHGLALLIRPAADGGIRKSWIQRITINGQTTNLGLGPYPLITLAEARRQAIENRRKVWHGQDPRRRPLTPTKTTFQHLAEKVIAVHAHQWKQSGRTAEKWRNTLTKYAYPRLAEMPVAAITRADVLATVQPIWATHPTTARTLLQRIGKILQYAVADGHRDTNPVDAALRAALPKQDRRVRHHPAIPAADTPAVLSAIQNGPANNDTKAAFQFLVLTATRTNETRLATSTEIDDDTWTIPADRMKNGLPHRVPLSRQALTLLNGRDNGYLFRGANPKNPLGHSTLLNLLRRAGINATPHGFRSTFRVWVAEHTDTPRAIAEAALAHQNADQVEAAYLRTDLLDRRRNLMQQWADYILPPS